MRKLTLIAIAGLLALASTMTTITPAVAKPCIFCCRIVIECGV